MKQYIICLLGGMVTAYVASDRLMAHWDDVPPLWTMLVLIVLNTLLWSWILYRWERWSEKRARVQL